MSAGGPAVDRDEVHRSSLAPWLKRPLADLLRQRAHAWLLQGPAGLGQYELALAVASAWLCETPGEEGACGHCASCHAIAVRTHADLCVLMPENALQTLGWPIDAKVQAELDDKKRKPSREIRVDALRDAVAFAQRTSARGRGKVVLVYPAERMNAIAANTLLKTLEEPVGEVRFVLATEAASQLLPTLRSRCLAITLRWPDTRQALAWLATQGVADADSAALLRAAGGRPRAALQMAQAGRSPGGWDDFPKALQRGDAAALANCSPAEAIDALQKVCHDLMAVRCGGVPRFFSGPDLPSAPSMSVLVRWSRALLQAARTAEHPFNPGLMLEALASNAHAALRTLDSAPKRP